MPDRNQTERDDIQPQMSPSDSHARAQAELREREPQLAAVLDALPAPEADDLDELLSALEQQLDAPAGPAERLRQLSTPLRAGLLTLVGAATFGLVFATLPRVDLEFVPLPRLLASLGLLFALVAAAGAWVVRPLHRRPLPHSMSLGVLGLLVVAPLVISLLPAAHHAMHESLLGVGEDLIPRALRCFGFGSGLAAVSVTAAWLLARQALRRSTSVVLAFVGAAGLANAILLIHCPLVDPVHKLSGHATISVFALVVAVVLTVVQRKRLEK